MNRPFLLALCLAANASAGVTTLPDPDSPLPEGETVVWSPLFQATWDAMNKHIGGKPQKINPPNKLMVRLDAFQWKPEDVMPEAAWKTWAGVATPDFLEQVNAEAAQMTGEADGPFRLSDGVFPGMLACFGLLDREVEYVKHFYRSGKVPLSFGAAKSPVRFFGAKGDQVEEYGEAVKVLAFRPVDGSHALEISCKNGDDKVILYRPAKVQDFATACRWIREWRKDLDENVGLPGNWDDTLLHEGDEVRVPYVTLEARADFLPLLDGRRIYGEGAGVWALHRAEQKTKFKLHEKGAKIRVEASMDPFGGKPPTYPRRFIYDRPFFVFLWREKAEWPYLGVWVGDDSALLKF